MDKTELLNLIKCRTDPWFFMRNFVKTLERDAGEKKFPDYKYLRELMKKFQSERRIVILKSRQMMVTWSAVAFALWEAIFRGSADILFLSKREDDAREAVRRLKFIFDLLPEYMKPKTGENTKYVLEFPGRNSRLMALPTHPNIGRTYSPSRIIWDEMASTPFDEEIFASIQPGLDGGGFFIGISTSQGPLTKHAELYMNAKAMGFAPIALHYSLNPQKDKKWSELARSGMSDRQWEIEQEMSMELGGDRVYASFQKQTHVLKKFEIDKEFPVYRTIDFGFHTPAVLWAQVINGKVVIFDEWIGEDNTVSDMAEAIIEVDGRNDLAETDVKMTYCDPAGAAKSDLGISSLDLLKSEFFERTGIDLKIKHRTSSVMAGVNLVREKLRNAAAEIKLVVCGGCTRTIADFGRYVKRKESEDPKKDGLAEHSMDALRYLIVNLFQKPRPRGRELLKPRVEAVIR